MARRLTRRYVSGVDVFAALSDEERGLLRPQGRPEWVEPMKAVRTDERFSRDDWLYERKFDGIRCLSFKADQRVRLRSRNDLSLNGRFPEIAAALEAHPVRDVVLDGEVVAFAGSQTSFERLQQRGEHPVRVFLYVFDVLHLAGCETTALPLRARKRLLRAALTFRDGVRWTQYRNEEGEALFAEACRKGWEGLIAKRADSPYAQRRSRDWLKLKCEHGQELVVGGWTAPRGSRTELGALLVGYYDGDGKLRYAGKVGTGFDRETLRELGARLRGLRREETPFAGTDARAIRERGVTWAQPELVAQVGFTEWTRDGRLRHPRFLGLRDDKPARHVVREA
jgi:DNA ligase D-like protein (predicted ligase)